MGTKPDTKPELKHTLIKGACTCGHIQFTLAQKPLTIHCCHCRWCQRETGSAFVLNAMIESNRVTLDRGEVTIVETPSASGFGQSIARCPHCQVAVWSHYGGMGPLVSFVRVGTLENAHAFPPDIHIFTSSKVPWVTIPRDAKQVEEFYDRRDYWPEESLMRHKQLLPAIKAYRDSLKAP